MNELIIDGEKLRARKGDTVLTVCQRAGIYIPTLCYQKELSPYGGCRLCLVEVKGWSKPVASCTLPAQAGMVVKTDSELLKKLRRFSLQLILSEHPHACLICSKEEDCTRYQECIQKTPITFGCKFCSKNGNCELQTLVDYLGVREIPFEFTYRNREIEQDDPFFERDYNLCILCGRCVRACKEVRRAEVLDFHQRGPETVIGTAFRLPHLEVKCQFCGACVDVCPTGALRDRFGKWRGTPDRSVKTYCLLCSLGCSVKVNMHNGQVVNTCVDRDQICVRGRFGIAPLVNHPRRVTVPQIKRSDRFVQIGWVEALDIMASHLLEHKGKTGILFSPQLTIEALEKLKELAHTIGCRDFATPALLKSHVKVFDSKKIRKNTVFVIVNTDMITDFSPLLLYLRKSTGNLRYLVIDPIASQWAEGADVWLRPIAGMEEEVVQSIFSKSIEEVAGIARKEIADAVAFLDNKHICLLYNQANLMNGNLPEGILTFPISSAVNILKIMEMGITVSMSDVLKNKNLDCLYLIGTAPPILSSRRTIILQDCFPCDNNYRLFLPSTTFLEAKGSIVSFNGRVKKLKKVIAPVGQSKSDEWILSELGKRLKGTVSSEKPRGTVIESSSVIRQQISKDFPLQLIQRENCYSYRSTRLSNLMKGFKRLRFDESAHIHPRTAKKYRIDDGALIRITGKTLCLQMSVRISEQVPEMSLLIYSHPTLGDISSQPVRIERLADCTHKT